MTLHTCGIAQTSAWDYSGPSATGPAFYGEKRRTSTAVADKFCADKPKRVTSRNPNQAVRQSAIDLPAMYMYRKQGHTWPQCGEKFGCSPSNARKRLIAKYPDAAGYCTANISSKVDNAVLVSLREMGHSYRLIAEAVRLPLSSVHWRVRKFKGAQ